MSEFDHASFSFLQIRENLIRGSNIKVGFEGNVLPLGKSSHNANVIRLFGITM